MKVIDLLNKIANGEGLPKKIRVFGEEFELDGREYYSVHSSSPLESYFGQDYFSEELKYEIEILDEEDAFIDIEELNTGNSCLNWTPKDQSFQNKINDIIKNQKKIINKLDLKDF